MDHFVRVIFDSKQNVTSKLDESIFPQQNLLETINGKKVIEIPLVKELTDSESDEYADRLSEYMFEQGYDNFDIEISSSEETYDGDDFFKEYGVLGYVDHDQLWEAEYQGKKVKLNKPIRSSNGPKKFHVYVKDPKTKNVKKVNFGDPNMEIKADNPERKKSFRARHNCDNPGPKTKARFWSCKKW